MILFLVDACFVLIYDRILLINKTKLSTVLTCLLLVLYIIYLFYKQHSISRAWKCRINFVLILQWEVF